MSLWILFLTSFLAATILPFSSEAHFLYLLYHGHPVVYLLFFATLGNFLGGLSTFLLGWWVKWDWIVKYLKVNRQKIENYQLKVQKYVGYLGFLTWLPFVGDLIAIALGVFRANIYITLGTMLLGKFLRYWVLTLI